MKLQNRIEILAALGDYLSKNNPAWQDAKKQAQAKNPWFTETFIDLAIRNIVEYYLPVETLQDWVAQYPLKDQETPKKVGIVMAGNIPLVGFHDFLTVFISGHHQLIKLSSKDDVLLVHLISYLHQAFPETQDQIMLQDNLKGCDAYITTGGNQSANYFEYYFAQYPSIIRRNKTSVAILTGKESDQELKKLAEDIHLYFGLGCRNVTKIYVPKGYDFLPLLQSFEAFKYFRDFQKYSNNYDYQLSLALLNHQYYMTNENTLLIENPSIFSPIGVLHYEYYERRTAVMASLQENQDIQCIVGEEGIPFGAAQSPSISEYADGVDTLAFLLTI
jgi:hypothetical protein